MVTGGVAINLDTVTNNFHNWEVNLKTMKNNLRNLVMVAVAALFLATAFTGAGTSGQQGAPPSVSDSTSCPHNRSASECGAESDGLSSASGAVGKLEWDPN